MVDGAHRDIALALSGGGYRAAHFHLGVLRKLRELELLERVHTISSVSGGSILASLYVASRLRGESFDTFEERALHLLRRRIPIHLSVAFDFVPFLSSGAAIEKVLTGYLRHEGRPIVLEQLEGVTPKLVINATNVRTGAGWRFQSGGVACHWELGTTHDQPWIQRYITYPCYGVTLARAVTASAAFPVFSAVRIPAEQIGAAKKVESDEFHRHLAYGLDRHLQGPLLLGDGGVRDNTGVTSVIAGVADAAVRYLIVSDAGVEARPIERRGPAGRPLANLRRRITDLDRRGKYRKFAYLKRSFDIRGRHNNQMTSLLALTDQLSRADRRNTAIFRIDRAIDTSEASLLEAAELHEIKTGLKRIGQPLEARLQRHGGRLLWERLTRHTDLLSDAQQMPGVTPRVDGDRLHEQLITDLRP